MNLKKELSDDSRREKIMKKTTIKKVLAVFLAIVITLSTLPLVAFAAPATSSLDGIIVDAPTIKEWKEYLGTAADGAISTEHSGFIWSDKSVFVDGGAYGTFEDYFPGLGAKLAVGKNNFGQSNFLVGLSTIGSTTEIIGYSVTPTDTMFVLDVSDSMDQSGSIPALISATNDAIASLLELNLHNRVGVVLFSGNSNFGASQTSTGLVILPLGRYTANASGDFLSYTGNSDTTVRVASGVKNADTNALVPTSSKNTSGGTYIQNGLYLAYNQFPSGNDTIIPDNKIQAGTQRMPILVLMTDGAPTTATTSYNNVGTSNAGNGGETTAAYSFFTQLTASWVNESLKEKYNGTDPKFYTLGLNTVNSTSATGVLNPESNSNAARNYWSLLTSNRSVTINNVRYASNNGSRNVTITMPTGMTLNPNYVDETWNASNANGLITNFNNIVEEIKIQSRYYGTLVTTGDYENDGYIYFTDEIGFHMEVKSFKGIHLGEGALYTGANFAKDIKNDYYYTDNSVTEEGRALYAALAKRLSVDETTVQALLNIAEQNGYISYTNDDVFSNYIAWYADENNAFVGVYNPKTRNDIPDNAKYLVKSYIFEGEVTASHAKSDMLFALIRVRENLETGRQILDAALPASLLPMVTNRITVNTDNANFTSADITSVTNNADDMHPAVLLYEVGLDSDITPYNITSLGIEALNKNIDGTYSFYSNRWRDDNGNAPTYNVNGALMTTDIHTTGVNYTPSYQNETYYYTVDTVIYKQSGNSYVAVSGNETIDAENNQYYWLKRFITKTANGTMSINEKYEPISKETVSDTTGNIIGTKDGNKIVKAGTPRKIVRDAAEKADNNPTGTIRYAEIAAVDKFGTVGGTEYHVYFFHGNNGKATVKPAQGIKITKAVSETVAGAGNEFVFDITLSNNNASQYSYRYEKADGSVLNGNVSVGAGNVITVTLGAGDVYYLTDLETGVSYTVTERYNAYYVAASTNSTGTISEYTLNDVDFVNTPRGYGSLMVEKEIEHSFDTLTNALASKQFDIKVTLKGQGADGAFYYDSQQGKNVYAVAVAGEEFTYEFEFKLTDAQSILISNIPEGVQYKVEEINIPNGFTLQDGTRSGTIANNTVSEVLLINKYEPSPLVPNITVSGVKNIQPSSYVWDDDDVYYVQIEQIDLSTGNKIGNGYTSRLDKNRQYYDISFANFLTAVNGQYTKPGVYVYKIYEYEFNPVADISYDKSIGLFAVTVEDNATGELTVAKVEAIQDLVSITQNGNAWTITKNFTNIYQSYQESFRVNKVVNGANGNAHRGGLIFGLFESQNATMPVMSAITDANGVADFTLNILQSDYASAKTYYIREIVPALDERVVGMTYNTETYYTVTIDWSDNTAAAPTVTYKNAAGGTVNSQNGLIIVNEYDDSVVSTPAITLSGVKTFKNPDGTDREFEGREFNFVAYTSNATFTAKTQLHKVGYNAANGRIIFPDITFDKVGTYYLIVEEEQGTLGGVNYDKSQYYVLINVVKAEENGKTVLKTDSVRVYKGGTTTLLTQDQINFNNTYTITDNETVTISGIKNLIGRPINPGEFRFNLIETGDDYSTVLANGITRYALNGAAHNNDKHKAEFTFEQIEFTAPGTHYFVVTEEIPTDTNGVTYSTEEYRIKVEIKDNNNGGLQAPIITYIDGDVEFTNTYNASSTSVGFVGKKTLQNKDLTADAFTFELHKTDKDFVVDTDKFGAPVTDKNDAQGNFGFTLTFEQGEEGHYYYVIKEYIPDERYGIHYDTNEYHIEIVVIDNGLGQMTSYAVVNLFGGESNISLTAVDFTNTYAVSPTEATIGGKKNLTGRDITADEFEFELYLANTQFEKQGDKLAIAKNDANGSFIFSYPIEIISEGTQYFTVVEKNLGAEHITYDNTVYGVKITATDNGVGEYTVEKEIINLSENQAVTEIEFNNTYTPPVPNIPVTGDYANFTLLISIMFISGGAFAGAVFYGKKRKEQN